MKRFVVVAALAACHHTATTTPPTTPVVHGTPIHIALKPQKTGIAQTKGTLAIMWAQASETPSLLGYRHMIERAYIAPGGDVDLAQPITVEVPGLPPGKLKLTAVVDVSHAGVVSLLGADPDAAIVVGIDNSTKTGASYLVDSPTTGKWDAFVSTRVLAYIDAHYRTIATRDGRAFVGHSTGAFLAVSYGLSHPDLVGVIGASSPDGLDFDLWLRGAPAAPVKPWIRGWAHTEHAMGGAGQFVSYAADWSANAWPFDASGGPVQAVLDHWIANTPGAWLADPAKVTRMKPFAGKIFLTVGSEDEFDLAAPTQAFSQELAAAGIANELLVIPGAGHGSKADEEHAAMVKFCLAHLAK